MRAVSSSLCIAVFVTLAISAFASCGVERWDVKTGTDSGANQVNLTPVSTTIAKLVAYAAPQQKSDGSRISPHEFTTATLKCTLKGFKSEKDSDYHLVLLDSSGNTMIAEIPLPDCVGTGSPFKNHIASARNEFDSVYSSSSTFKTVNVPVVVTGVMFFDFLHGQTGVAPNGIELHPILDIQFLSSNVEFPAINATDASSESESEMERAAFLERHLQKHALKRQQRYRGARRVPANQFDHQHGRVPL